MTSMYQHFLKVTAHHLEESLRPSNLQLAKQPLTQNPQSQPTTLHLLSQHPTPLPLSQPRHQNLPTTSHSLSNQLPVKVRHHLPRHRYLPPQHSLPNLNLVLRRRHRHRNLGIVHSLRSLVREVQRHQLSRRNLYLVVAKVVVK